MAIRLALTLLVLISLKTTAQEDNGKVNLRISIDSVFFSDTATVVVRLTCENKTNVNLIFYGMNFKARNIPVQPDTLCNASELTSSGVALFFYNEKLRRIYPKRKRFALDYKEITKQHLDSVFLIEEKNYLLGTGIADAFNSVSYEHKINLKNYSLESGEYIMQLVFFTGEGIFRLLDSEQIKADLIRFNAQVFQGCLKSNKIFFTIR